MQPADPLTQPSVFIERIRLDLENVDELCRTHKVMLNLDAIQLLGALHLDVSRYPIDFLSAGGLFWPATCPAR